MAAVFTETSRIDLGNGNLLVTGTLAMDSSYPTGGETLDVSSYFGGGNLYFVAISPGTSGGYILASDGGTTSAQKIKAYYCDYDAVADGALIQVANATDLSAITAAEMIMIGQ